MTGESGNGNAQEQEDPTAPNDPVPAAPWISSDLAYADARRRVLVRGASGGSPRVIANDAAQPTWAPDGRLAYVTGPNGSELTVVLRSPHRRDDGEALTDAGPYHRPAISPKGDVLLVIREETPDSGAGTLCFSPIPAEGAIPDCLAPDPDWVYGRPAWSPDGDEVLALARDRDDEVYTRLVLFTAEGPDRSIASAWKASPEPLLERPYIHYVAWSRSAVAVLDSDSATTTTKLTLYAPRVGTSLDPEGTTSVTGCQAAWDADGRLAIAERGCLPTDTDGPIRLIDPRDPDAPAQELATGRDPAWSPR